jgi:hypothetical protein
MIDVFGCAVFLFRWREKFKIASEWAGTVSHCEPARSAKNARFLENAREFVSGVAAEWKAGCGPSAWICGVILEFLETAQDTTEETLRLCWGDRFGWVKGFGTNAVFESGGGSDFTRYEWRASGWVRSRTHRGFEFATEPDHLSAVVAAFSFIV